MGKRRKSRELALQILYSISVTQCSISEAIFRFQMIDIESATEVNEFSRKLLNVTLKNKKKIGEELQSIIENWSLERLSLVDKNILELATSELIFFDDIPPKVTINEYIEIAKEYGDKKSPGFINGILDQIAKKKKD